MNTGAANIFLKAVGDGFVNGLTIMGLATLVLLPISFLMNRYAYKSFVKRLMMGVMAFNLAPILLVILVVYRIFSAIVGTWEPTHYFGLVPIWSATGDVTGADVGGYILPMFLRIKELLTHPFRLEYNADALKELVKRTYVRKDDPDSMKVDEDLFEVGRLMGAISDKRKWGDVNTAVTTILEGGGTGTTALAGAQRILNPGGA